MYRRVKPNCCQLTQDGTQANMTGRLPWQMKHAPPPQTTARSSVAAPRTSLLERHSLADLGWASRCIVSGLLLHSCGVASDKFRRRFNSSKAKSYVPACLRTMKPHRWSWRWLRPLPVLVISPDPTRTAQLGEGL